MKSYIINSEIGKLLAEGHVTLNYEVGVYILLIVKGHIH